MFVGGFFIPLTIIVILNILTKQMLNKRKCVFKQFSQHHFSMQQSSTKSNKNYQKEVAKNEIESNETTSKLTCTLDDVSYSPRKRKKLSNHNNQVLKMIVLNIVLFCFAWTPYAIVILIAQFGNNIDKYITPYTVSIPALFAKISSVYNPILYTLSNQECKAYFKRNFSKN